MQKIINTNSFDGHVQEDIISCRKFLNTNSRVSEVDGCLPASSYIRHRILMYELAGDFTKK